MVIVKIAVSTNANYPISNYKNNHNLLFKYLYGIAPHL